MKLKKLKKKIQQLEKRLREGPERAGQVKAQTAAGRVGKGVESCEKIGRPSHCVSRKEVLGANNRREETKQCQESQEETESLTGTSCSTCRRDESQVGCKEGR